MSLSERTSEKDSQQPSYPHSAEEFDVVLSQLLHEEHRANTMKTIERIEDRVLSGVSVLVDSSVPSKNLIVEE